MLDRRAFRGLPLAGAAGVGVVVGHWLAYAVAMPDPHLRAELLGQTGHGYWVLAVKSAAALALAALAVLALRLVSGEPPHEEGRRRTYLALLWRLSVTQLVAFSILEASERAAAGAPLAGLWDHHVFLLGLIVQVLVAAIGSVVLLAFAGVVLRVVAALHRSRPRPALRILPPRLHHPFRRPRLLGGTPVRAPPSR